MSRDVRLYLDDILANCNKAIRYASGMSSEDFEKNEQAYDAVLWNLYVIGEAANARPVDLASTRSRSWRNGG